MDFIEVTIIARRFFLNLFHVLHFRNFIEKIVEFEVK